MTDLKAASKDAFHSAIEGPCLLDHELMWNTAVEWTLAHLSQLAGEVDEHALEEQGEIYLDGKHRDRAAFAAKSGFKSGARWQFDQISARVGLSESRLDSVTRCLLQMQNANIDLVGQIKSLEQQLAEANRELSECGAHR